MIKTYKNYLIKLFLKKTLTITSIFFLLIFILSVFEEITFFKDLNVSFFFPLLMTFLNTPSTLFEIFPFIFLISTQFFFIELINKSELEIFKVNGLNNFKIIKVLFFTSFILGLLITILFYNFSSKLKFIYLDLKNNYSSDNKYLAVSTENGLWIKDEIDNKIYISNASIIDNDFLHDVTISEFDKNFDLIQIIKSKKVDISSKRWVVFNPIISKNNNSTINSESIILMSHFDKDKINSLFENLSSISLFSINKLMDDYKELGYSTLEIKSYLYKLYSLPLFLSIMTVFASIIMLNIKRSKPLIFHIILGIMLSVIIYYITYLFNLFGVGGNVPPLLSVLFPLFILSVIILIGLIRINEK